MSQKNPNKPGSSEGDVRENRININTAELATSGTSSSVLEENVGIKAQEEHAFRTIQEVFEDRVQQDEAFCIDTLKRNVKELRRSDKVNKKYGAIMSIAKMLKRSSKSSVDTAAKHGVIPICVDFLKNEPNPKLQFGAACALVNIAESNQGVAKVVVDAGAVNPLIKMLNCKDIKVVTAAACALGSIAITEVNREHLDIHKITIPVMFNLAKASGSASDVRVVLWNLGRVCTTYKHLYPEEATKFCIPVFASLLTSSDMQTVEDLCSALHKICCTSPEILELIVEQIIESGAVPRLVKLLDCGNGGVITKCLQAVTYLVGISELRTQHFIDFGILPKLANLLESSDTDVVWYATWTVRNIAEICTSQLSEIVQAGIVPLLVQVLSTGKLDARKEAVLALKHIALETDDNINHLYDAKAIPAVCDMLRIKDPDANLATLDAILTILKTATKFDHFDNMALAFEECGGLELIEGLQNHENEEIYKKAFDIIDQFFSE